jgi:hypothetical protein
MLYFSDYNGQRDEGTFKYCTSEADGKKHVTFGPITTTADVQS